MFTEIEKTLTNLNITEMIKESNYDSEVCKLAVQVCPKYLQDIPYEHQEYYTVSNAVENDGIVLQFASDEFRNDEYICEKAVSSNWKALQFADNQSFSVISAAMSASRGKAIQFVRDRTQDIILAAISYDKNNCQFLTREDIKLSNNGVYLVQKDYRCLEFIPEDMRTPEVLLMARINMIEKFKEEELY